ncbi:MAG TPA: winged helix-turn-helix domain-containing protein [Capillimicrobium sp.]|nr:winged helix-turn-helix domain-containing protein [Capillimicrobium sp.]
MEQAARRLRQIRMAKVMSHPTRVRALDLLRDGKASASELGRKLGVSTQNVAYHLSVMLRHGAIEEVETVIRGGATETYYRAVPEPVVSQAEYAKTPRADRNRYTEQIVRSVYEDVRRAIETDSLQRDDHAFTTDNLTLDDEGWREIYEFLVSTRDRILGIQDASVQRIADGADAIGGRFSIQLYEAPPPTA